MFDVPVDDASHVASHDGALASAFARATAVPARCGETEQNEVRNAGRREASVPVHQVRGIRSTHSPAGDMDETLHDGDRATDASTHIAASTRFSSGSEIIALR